MSHVRDTPVAAEIYTEHGGVVTTVSDAVGAVHNPKGLDILALRRHIAEGNKLAEFNGGEAACPGRVSVML